MLAGDSLRIVTSMVLRILMYTSIAYVSDTHIQRMAEYFCSCEINFKFDPTSVLPPPTRDQCNAPDNYCQRSGYCKRASYGTWAWANLGECY